MGLMKKIFGGMPGTDDHGAVASEAPEDGEAGHTIALNPGDGSPQDEAEAGETKL